MAAALYKARRRLKITPIYRVLREIKRRRLDLSRMDALELFGGRGDMITQDYAPYVRSLEIWEIDPACESALREHFPLAEVKITDTYEEIKRCARKFDLVVADAWPRPFDGRCEHFDLFPDIFRLLSPFAVLILNVLPEIWGEKLSSEHARRRRKFYQIADPTRVSLQQMVRRYEALAREQGFIIRWWFYKDRYFLYQLRRPWRKKRLGFLVLGLERVSRTPDWQDIPLVPR
jgi:hypothetical protein